MTMSIVREFGAELRQAQDPQHRKWPAACAVASVAVATALVVSSSGDVAEPALAVSHRQESIVITLRQPRANERELTRELRAAGIKGQVRKVPTTRPFVDRWVGAASAQTTAASQVLPLAPNARAAACSDLTHADEPTPAATASDGTTVTLSQRSARKPIVLLVGREPRSGEAPLYAAELRHNGDGDVVLSCSTAAAG
jgi:hypothetical protein